MSPGRGRSTISLFQRGGYGLFCQMMKNTPWMAPSLTLWGLGCGCKELSRVGNIGVCVTCNKPLCAVTLKDTGRGSCPLDWQHNEPPEEWPAGTYFLLQSPPPPGPGENDKVTWLFIPLCVVFKSLTYANWKNRFQKSV